MKFLVSCTLFSLSLFVGMSVQAGSKQDESTRAALQKNLAQARPGLQVLSASKSDVGDLYEAMLNNGDVVYTTKKGEYLILGKVLRLDEGRLVDVQEEKLVPLRAQTLADISVKDSINFSPVEGETSATIYVFTDVDCGYCQKLHGHMDEFNAMGVEVRYLAFPRAKPESVSGQKLINAWCADDRNDAMNKLKRRQRVPEANCENPVAAQYELGKKLGVSGTPAIFTTAGISIGGYLTPEQMQAALNLKPKIEETQSVNVVDLETEAK